MVSCTGRGRPIWTALSPQTHWVPLVRVGRCLSGAGGNQDLLQCNETKPAGMKPFSGVHEAMVKPPATRKRSLETTGQGRCIEGDDRHGAREKAMSQVRKAFLGAVAVTLTLGAVQFASGHDLVNRLQRLRTARPDRQPRRQGRSSCRPQAFCSSDENGFLAPERSRRYLGLAAYSVCAGPHHQAADAAAKSEP